MNLKENMLWIIIIQFILRCLVKKELFCYSFLKLKDNFSKHREDVINGYAFEIFTRLNINLIREALGRSSLNFKTYTWNNEHAQIDLVLEDEDNSYYRM